MKGKGSELVYKSKTIASWIFVSFAVVFFLLWGTINLLNHTATLDNALWTGGASIVGVSLTVSCCLALNYTPRYLRELGERRKRVIAERDELRRRSFSSDAVRDILEIIKKDKILKIGETSRVLRVEPEQVRAILYGLLGEKKLLGEFRDLDIFSIQTEIDDAIFQLQQEFTAWEAKAK